MSTLGPAILPDAAPPLLKERPRGRLAKDAPHDSQKAVLSRRGTGARVPTKMDQEDPRDPIR
jgi:hypothetical protein